MLDHKLRKHISLIKFWFPLYPVKVFKTTSTLVMLAILIALRIILNLIAIPIPLFVQSISLAWLPVMMLGWLFGPVYGFIFGTIMDTLTFFIYPGSVWFWMYAIQEPCVGMVAGLLASFCRWSITKNKHKRLDIVIQQVIYLTFTIVSYVIVVVWLTPSSNKFQENNYQIFRWLSFGFLTLFFIGMEIFTIYEIKNKGKDINQLKTFIYSSCVAVVTMLIFSIALGPIVTVEYLKYINGVTPGSWIKYGAMYYLIPRVIADSIKVPIEAVLMTTLVFVLQPIMNKTAITAINTWE